jgi:pimeloyl-ACP methyl ester carboxylesterase
LLHGLADSWRSFEPLLAHLPPSLRVIAPTFRGHGLSDHPDAGYGLSDLAGDVRQLLDALELRAASIAGHSLGASTALRFALDHGERTRGIALIGAFARYRHNPAINELASAVSQLVDPVDSTFIRDFQLATLARPIAPERIEQVVTESRALPARVWKAILDGLMSPESDLPLSDVRARTLLLWGGRDAFVPRADQERLMRDIRGARLIEFANGGHALHWEEPERAATELGAFAEACLADDPAHP